MSYMLLTCNWTATLLHVADMQLQECSHQSAKLMPDAERCTYAQRLRVFATTFTGTLGKTPGLTGLTPSVWLVSL